MCIELLNNSDLVRCIDTTKNYVLIDTGYSSNHSVGKTTFTNNLPTLDESIYCADLACCADVIHSSIVDMVNRVSKALGRDCYYDTLENNLKSYGLTEYKYQKALKYLRDNN